MAKQVLHISAEVGDVEIAKNKGINMSELFRKSLKLELELKKGKKPKKQIEILKAKVMDLSQQLDKANQENKKLKKENKRLIREIKEKDKKEMKDFIEIKS